MPDVALFAAFLLASLVVAVTPGPDLAFVGAQSVARGRSAGLIASLGTSTGLLVHAGAATLGISSLFLYAPLAFEAVRWSGVAYLAWLAVRTLRGRDQSLVPSAIQGGPAVSLASIYRQALLTNVLNPKVAIFFIAYLPQFARPGEVPVPLQVAFLGLVFILQGLLVLVGFVLLCARFGDLLRGRPRFLRLQRWFLGTVFAGLACWLALAERR